MNMPRRVTANETFDDVATAPDFAHAPRMMSDRRDELQLLAPKLDESRELNTIRFTAQHETELPPWIPPSASIAPCCRKILFLYVSAPLRFNCPRHRRPARRLSAAEFPPSENPKFMIPPSRASLLRRQGG